MLFDHGISLIQNRDCPLDGNSPFNFILAVVPVLSDLNAFCLFLSFLSAGKYDA